MVLTCPSAYVAEAGAAAPGKAFDEGGNAPVVDREGGSDAALSCPDPVTPVKGRAFLVDCCSGCPVPPCSLRDAVGRAKGRTASGRPSDSGSGGATGGPAAPSGVLGANFNEDPSDMRFSQLRELSAGWLRGFLPMPEADEGPPARQRAVATLISASKQGYGTILSLKFPYSGRALPKAGSALMDAELQRVDKVARAVMGTVDILVIGNEPFLETRPVDRDGPAVNAFYEHVARHLIAYRKQHFGARCKTRLYMGALNRLDDPERRTEATRRWVKFVHDTTEIEGVDIHPHVVSIDAAQTVSGLRGPSPPR